MIKRRNKSPLRLQRTKNMQSFSKNYNFHSPVSTSIKNLACKYNTNTDRQAIYFFGQYHSSTNTIIWVFQFNFDMHMLISWQVLGVSIFFAYWEKLKNRCIFPKKALHFYVYFKCLMISAYVYQILNMYNLYKRLYLYYSDSFWLIRCKGYFRLTFKCIFY